MAVSHFFLADRNLGRSGTQQIERNKALDVTQPTQDELNAWKCIWSLAAKPLVTDRHFPREYMDLWQQVCLQVLREQMDPNDMSPCVSDLFFVLPKLILCSLQGLSLQGIVLFVSNISSNWPPRESGTP